MITCELSLQQALNYSLSEIEKFLDVKIIGLERITKIYGSKADSFFVKMFSVENKITTYFLKFNEKEHIENELKGTRFIEKFLSVPKIVLNSKKKIFLENLPLLISVILT